MDKLNKKFGLDLIHAEVKNLSWKHDEPKDSEKYLEIIVVTHLFESIKKQEVLIINLYYI